MPEHFSEELLIAGVGGQGVLSLGQILAQAATAERKWATWVPSYGAEMRGGVTTCTVIISNQPVVCPIVDRFCSLIALAPETLYLGSLVEPGGLLLSDVTSARTGLVVGNIQSVAIPASDFGQQLSLGQHTNIVFLGAYLALRPVVGFSAVESTLEKMFGQTKEIVALNRRSLMAGKEYIEGRARR